MKHLLKLIARDESQNELDRLEPMFFLLPDFLERCKQLQPYICQLHQRLQDLLVRS